MKKLYILISAFLLASACASYAHANTIDVYVLKFETLPNDEHLIVLQSESENSKSQTFNTLIKFNTEKTGHSFPDATLNKLKTDFTKASEILKKSQSDKTKIRIAKMSSTGFNPIKNRPNFYRSEMIRIVDWFDEPVVCFFHSNQYFYAPK